MLRLLIEYDPDTPNPTDQDGWWTVVDFNNRHANYTDIDEYFNAVYDEYAKAYRYRPKFRLFSKLRYGTAFELSYMEHGNCQWRVSPGNNSPAGILLWNYPPSHLAARTYAERKSDAEVFVEEYTDWCNGNCYWFQLTRVSHCASCGQQLDVDVDLDVIDTCGGFIGDKYIFDEIRECLRKKRDPDEELVVSGSCAWLADNEDLNVYRNSPRKLLNEVNRILPPRSRYSRKLITT